MNNITRIIFINLLALVAFIAIGVSQTVPRDSTGHYLCLAAFVLGITYAGYLLFNEKKVPDSRDE